jgi:hypothetical protein
VAAALGMIACGSSSSGGGAGTGGAAGSGAHAGTGTGGGAAGEAGSGSGGASGSGGSAGGSSPTAQCQDPKGGPVLVIVSDPEGATGKADAVLRVPLSFSAPVSGLVLGSVEQRDAGDQLLRSWNAADFSGPPGFDGNVAWDNGQAPVVLVARTTALEVETEGCALAAWERKGKVTVAGSTNEGGAFEVECDVGNSYYSGQRWSCAKGLPGWLYGQTSVTNTITPYPFALADSTIHVQNTSASAWTSFAVTGATLHAGFTSSFDPPCTSPPETWELADGKHDLWRGQTSDDKWSGPVAPGSHDWANWFWQKSGAQLPDGVCFKPSTEPPTDPFDQCQNPILQLMLRGTSSAGAWEWESDLFECYDLGP